MLINEETYLSHESLLDAVKMEVTPKDLEWLEHHGVKGMHWGVHNNPGPGLPRVIERPLIKAGEAIRGNQRFTRASNGSRGKVRLTANEKTKAVHKQGIDDFNNLTRNQFFKKNATTKTRFLHRVLGPRSINATVTVHPGSKSSAGTKKIMNDHNTMSNHEFSAKYGVTKRVYAFRVHKHGDPAKKSNKTEQYIQKLINNHGG